jgi:hypothetical protein
VTSVRRADGDECDLCDSVAGPCDAIRQSMTESPKFRQ